MHKVQVLSGLILCGLAACLFFYFWRLKKQLSAAKTQLEQCAVREKQHDDELAAYKNKCSKEIATDAVTGLPTLSLFKEEVQRVIKQCQVHQRICGILLLDLRNFHVINNTLGYAIGDRLLKEVAERLQTSVRHMDMVCRFSGDVFVILLSKLNHPDSATLVIQRFFNKLTELFHVANRTLCIPSNVGIAIYPRDGEDVDTLLKNAAQALSQAKQAGGQQFEFYHSDLRNMSRREFLLNTALSQDALFEALLLEYQPQIDLNDNAIVCWEALLRWQHPELGFIPAGEFIQLAESSGRINAIGNWVLQKACQQIKAWQSQAYPLPAMALNISARQLQGPHFVSLLMRVLQETEVDPKLLMLEISEADFLKMGEPVEKVFSFLRQWGVRIIVDQFGTADAVLRQMKHLPIDGFKLSSKLVQEAAESKESTAIVTMMISLAKSLNKQIVAQGVETEEQKQLLQQLGCTIMQGHFFSLPLSEQDVLKKFILPKIKSIQQENLKVF